MACKLKRQTENRASVGGTGVLAKSAEVERNPPVLEEPLDHRTQRSRDRSCLVSERDPRRPVDHKLQQRGGVRPLGNLDVEEQVAVIPHVVLMDIRMPVLDGLAATRLICAGGTLQRTRVLVLTTFDIDGYIYEALRAGASGSLLKETRPSCCTRSTSSPPATP